MLTVAHVLFSFYRHLENGEPDLPFKIELWDDHDRHVEEVIALTSDFANACGAYEEAVKCRPGKLITLRQKARVIKKVAKVLVRETTLVVRLVVRRTDCIQGV